MKKILDLIILFTTVFNISAFAQKKTWAGYFRPMRPQESLVAHGVWGGENVLPRDTANGLEDTHLKNWCYWDGMILKGDDGRYHMYGSRWPQTVLHAQGWKIESKAMHAVSDNVMGPYKDQGLCWPQWNGGKGHNVSALRMSDGHYAVVTSEITKGEVFISDSPDGPFKLLGEIQVDDNGYRAGLARYSTNGHMANVVILLRPDGRYMLVGRSTAVTISDKGILGPYKIMSDRIYQDMPGIPQQYMEDPTVWYSGGMYHMVVNHWPTQTEYLFTSQDGIHNWKSRGVFISPEKNIFRYTDGTQNHWTVIQRPVVFLEKGHPAYFTFSVIDSKKGEDRPDDNHGSKVVVVPFDGKAFDRDMMKLVKSEK